MGSSHGGAQGTVRYLGKRKREQEEKEVKEKISARRDFGLQQMGRDSLLCRFRGLLERSRESKEQEITMGNLKKAKQTNIQQQKKKRRRRTWGVDR